MKVRRFLEQLLALSVRTRSIYTQLLEESIRVMESAAIRMYHSVDQLMVNREWNVVEEASVRHYGGSQSRVQVASSPTYRESNLVLCP